MRLSLRVFFIVFFFSVISVASKAEITLKDLIFDDSKPYHIKILETLPKNAIIQVGPDNAKHTVIEFFDYFCGYCKKIHPELINLANSRDDVRVVFLQHPILNESSNVIARFAIAANMQGKGIEFHNEIKLKDVFRSLKGYTDDSGSWFTNKGVGRRYDHIFCSTNFNIKSCSYYQQPRLAKLSDHSPIIAELKI